MQRDSIAKLLNFRDHHDDNVITHTPPVLQASTSSKTNVTHVELLMYYIIG
jgi:hypothetical protein